MPALITISKMRVRNLPWRHRVVVSRRLTLKVTNPIFKPMIRADLTATPAAQNELANTAKLAAMKVENFDAIFYPGGHGPLWDLHNDNDSIALIEGFIAAGKPVATVCHAPAVLLKAMDQNGDPMVKGKHVTGFSNSEEAAVDLVDVVPYLLEDELIALGGKYQKVEDWNSLAIVDGLVITGQNPGSSAAVAEALVKVLLVEPKGVVNTGNAGGAL